MEIILILAVAIFLCMACEKIYSWNFNRSINRSIEKIKKDMKEGKDIDRRILENPKNGVISIHDSKVHVKSPQRELEVSWDKIDKILCYKEDLWAYDLVCVGFSYVDDQPMVVVTEEMLGFFDLIQELDKKFPELEKQYHEWLFGSEPFDKNVHVLWDRRNQSA